MANRPPIPPPTERASKGQPLERATDRQIFHVGDGVAVAQYGRLCVVIWRDAVTRPRFERQRAGLAAVVRNQPDGAGFLCVIEPSSKPPDEELRRASTEMIASHGEHLKCTAVVVQGEGFKAAITRSVLSGMTLLFSRKVETKFCSNTPAALKWMRAHLDIPYPEQAATFVDEVQRRLDESGPVPESNRG